MTEHTFADVTSAIANGDRFVLTSHVHPDGDALGSCLALAELLEALGKTVTVYNQDAVSHHYEFLPTFDRVVQALPETFDSVFVMECPDAPRIGNRMEFLLEHARQVVNIDHHASNSRYGTVNYIDCDAAAVGELVYPLFKHFQVPVNRAAAIALWTSLMSDTGSFRYDNTRPETLRVAATLLEHGFDPSHIYDSVYEQSTFADTQLLGRCLQAVQLAYDGRLAYVEIPHTWYEETGGTAAGLANLSEQLRGIIGVEVSCVLREDNPGSIKCSMRSRTKADVHAVCKQFGGGGHKKASGCTIEGAFAEVTPRVLAALGEQLAATHA